MTPEERLRDLVSRLGFGDGVTEPMADNDTIVRWFEERALEANEWVESQQWRNECLAAGHPDDQDCPEHDPALRLMLAEQRFESLVYEHAATVDGEWGCSHNGPELRAGGRPPGYQGDTFDPLPDDCPGAEIVDTYLGPQR